MSSASFPSVSTNGLSFTNITATEADTGAVVPFASNSGNFEGVDTPTGAELSWGGAAAAVYYAGSSQVVNFSYSVSSTSSTSLIDSVGQVYVNDSLNGPGVSLVAVENVYDTAGNLIGSDTFTAGTTNVPSVTLSHAEQTVNVKVTLTMAVSSAGNSSSVVGISAIDQSFGTVAAPPATASIGDIVFNDTNGSGLEAGFDSGPGVAGVTVDLLNGNGTTVLATTVTNSSGGYNFTGLAAGVYEVKFVAPTGFGFTTQGVGTNPGINSSANATTGITAPITLTAGQADHNVEAGLVLGGSSAGGSGEIGNTVWMDTNRDGLITAGETGVAGVTVDLLNGTGSVLATTVTNSSGTYAFTGLNAGVYEVQFVAPTGDQFTTQGSTQTATDSSANVSTGITAPVTLAAGQVDNNVNAGLVTPPASLGSTVWMDTNRDGQITAGETGVAGVTVDLLNGTGSVLATTVTNSSGTYAFTGLNAGVYEVKFVAPTGDQFTTQGSTQTATDSSANVSTGITAPVTLAAGQVDNNVNAGLVTPLTGSIGDYVWLDLNKNGLVNTGEPGVAGVTVDLLNAAGTTVLATTTTNNSGGYNFTGLNAGVYEVKFIAPAGDSFTTQGASQTATDSSPNVSTGITAPITLGAGQVDNNVNAGLQNSSSITVLKLPCSVVANQCGQVTYTFDVTNTGSTALTNVKITDNIGSTTNPEYITPTLVTTGTNGILKPGQTWVYSETVSQVTCTTGSNNGWGGGSNSGDGGNNSCGSGGNSGDGSNNSWGGGRNSGDGSNNSWGGGSNSGDGSNNSCGGGSNSGDGGNNSWGGGSNSGDNNNNSWGGASNSGDGSNWGGGRNSGDSTSNWGGGRNSGDSTSNCGSGSNSGDGSNNSWGGGSNSGDSSSNCGSGSNSGDNSNNTCGGGSKSGDSSDGSTGSCGHGGSPTPTTTNIAGAADTVTVTAQVVTGTSCATKTVSGSDLSSGCTAWLHSTFKPTSCRDGATYNFTNVTCTIEGSGKPITVKCPDAEVKFSSACKTATTVFDASTKRWVTTLPANSAPGNVFLTGCPTKIPSGTDLTNGHVTWSIGGSTNNCGASTLKWDGSCTGFKNFDKHKSNGNTNYNAIGVKSCDNLPTDGNHTESAGAPVKQYTARNCGNSASITRTQEDTNTCGTSCTVTSTGATVTATDTKEVQVLGCNSNVSVGGTAPTGSLSATYGTAQTLEFTYKPGNTVSLKQVQAGLASVTGTNGASMAFMEISNNANPYASGAAIYFRGEVTSGEKIFADATTNVLTNTAIAGGHFSSIAGSDIYAAVFSSQQAFLQGAAPVQTMAYNTSGSQAMHIGDTIGSLSVVGYVGAKGGHLIA